eukprot:gene12670-20526_t
MSSELETEKALWKQYPRAAATEFAKKLFAEADTGGDGALSKNEVKKYFKSHPVEQAIIMGETFSWQPFFVEFTRVVVERVLAAESSSESGGTAPTQAWQDPPDKLTSAPAPELETAAEENQVPEESFEPVKPGADFQRKKFFVKTYKKPWGKSPSKYVKMAPADRVYSAASSWSPTKTAGSGSTVSDNSTLGPQSRAPGSASPRKFIVPKHSKPWHQNDTKVSTRSELIKSPTRGTTSPTKARSLTSSVRSPTKGMRTPLPGMVVDSWGREVPARKSKANTTFYLPKKGEQRAATPTSTSPTRTASPPKKTTSVGARPASPTKGSAKKKRPLSQAEKEQLEDERLEQLEREQEAREQAERSLNISARAEAARYARQVFADADRDGNGTLSKNEVRAYFKSHPEDREVVLGSSFRWKSIFARMDSDGDGKFTVVEFTRTVAGQVLAKKKAEARRAQLVELATKGKGFQASRKALFVEVDTDGDGNWSWVEAFKAIQSRWPDFDNDSACRMAFQASTRNGLNLDPREMRLFFQYQLHYDDAWETFNTLDEDEDGLITLTDIVSAPYKLGLKATDDLVSIFRAMCRKSPPGKNAAGENAVNLAEFSTWLGLNAFISVENKANRDDIERAFTASKSWWGKTAADWAAQDAAAVAAVEEAASAATARAAFLLTPEGQAQLAADRAAQEKKEEEDRAAAESKKAAEKVLAVQMEARAFAKALFAGADKDGNGTLSKTEVRKYFAANTAERDAVLGTSFQWKTFFASIDADGDGKFDVVEFTKGVVTRVLAKQEA